MRKMAVLSELTLARVPPLHAHACGDSGLVPFNRFRALLGRRVGQPLPRRVPRDSRPSAGQWGAFRRYQFDTFVRLVPVRIPITTATTIGIASRVPLGVLEQLVCVEERLENPFSVRIVGELYEEFCQE